MAQPRFGLVRSLLANVFLLSALYLALGLGLELLRRWVGWSWPSQLLMALDGLPSRVLSLLGVLGPLREAYGHGELSTWALRAIFSLATLSVIALTAIAVGLVMAGITWMFRRRVGD